MNLHVHIHVHIYAPMFLGYLLLVRYRGISADTGSGSTNRRAMIGRTRCGQATHHVSSCIASLFMIRRKKEGEEAVMPDQGERKRKGGGVWIDIRQSVILPIFIFLLHYSRMLKHGALRIREMTAFFPHSHFTSINHDVSLFMLPSSGGKTIATQ